MALKVIKRNNTLHIEGTILGKRIRKTTGLPTHRKKEAEKLRVQWEKDVVDGIHNKLVLVQCLLDVYSNNRELGNTEQRVVKSLSDEYGKKDVKHLTVANLRKFVLEKWGDLNPSSRARYIKVINAVINEGNRTYDMSMSRVPNPRVDDARDEHLNEWEVRSLFECCKNTTYEYHIQILILCGLRLGEMLRLKGTDFNGNEVFVRCASQHSKTNNRVIPVLYEPLLTHLRKFVGKDIQICDDVSSAKLNEFLRSSLNKIGITRHVRVHDLRHTFAWLVARNGCDIADLQLLMGHQDISQTMRYRGWVNSRATASLNNMIPTIDKR